MPSNSNHIRFDDATPVQSQAYRDGLTAGRRWAEDNSRSMGERLLHDNEYAAGCAAGAAEWIAVYGTAQHAARSVSPEILREVHLRR